MKTLPFVLCVLALSAAHAQSPGEFHLDKDYKIGKTGTLDLSASDANVYVTGSNRTTAHVKVDRVVTTKGWGTREETFDVTVEEENGDLKIREKQNSHYSGLFGYYNEDYKIEIEIPNGVSLVVRGDDGDYFIKNINGSISLSLDDADAELSDCLGNQFKFRLDDGDLRMNQGKGKLEVKGDDADVFIYKGNFSEIDATLDDGEMTIETSLTNSGNYYLKTEDGSVVMNILGGGGTFEIRHDDGRVITEGNFKTLVESEKETKVSLASGSAVVRVEADDARVRLKSN
jgi:hypothetical protein